MFRRIVCATDFSEPGAVAIRYAASMARASHCALEIVHAWDFPPIVVDELRTIPKDTLETSRLSAQSALARAVESVGGDVQVTGQLIVGTPDRAIVAHVAASGADLLVTGTEGRRGIAHALLGSVAERILRTSSVPVLAVPKTTSVAADARFAPKRIVVPVDLEPHSAAALRSAITLASHSHARVVVVYAWQPSLYAAQSAEISTRTERTEREGLEVWTKRALEGSHAHVDHVAREGEPAEVIAEIAREQSADLLVMATAGRTGITHFMLGSVTERTLRTAGVPILTYRSA